MKKLFGLAALVVAIALVSFTNVKRATHDLSFVGSTFSSTDVADETKWQEISPINGGFTSEVACRLVVPDDTYIIVATPPAPNYLNVARVNLGAVVGYTSGGVDQYKANKIGGSGSTPTFTLQAHQ